MIKSSIAVSLASNVLDVFATTDNVRIHRVSSTALPFTVAATSAPSVLASQANPDVCGIVIPQQPGVYRIGRILRGELQDTFHDVTTFSPEDTLVPAGSFGSAVDTSDGRVFLLLGGGNTSARTCVAVQSNPHTDPYVEWPSNARYLPSTAVTWGTQVANEALVGVRSAARVGTTWYIVGVSVAGKEILASSQEATFSFTQLWELPSTGITLSTTPDGVLSIQRTSAGVSSFMLLRNPAIAPSVYGWQAFQGDVPAGALSCFADSVVASDLSRERLGTMAGEDADNVSITGGSITNTLVSGNQEVGNLTAFLQGLIGTGNGGVTTVLFLGDSMVGEANGVCPSLGSLLTSRCGNGGMALGNAGGAPSAGASSVTGGSTANAAIWPTGEHYVVPANGVVTFGNAGGNNPIQSNELTIYYIKEPGAGTFKVSSKLGSGAWTDEIASVDASNATRIGAVASVTAKSTAGAYLLRVTGLTGTVKIIGACFKDTTQPVGVCLAWLFANSGQGGDLVNAQGEYLMPATPTAILHPILTHLAPSLVVYMSADGWRTANDPSKAAWDQLRTRWTIPNLRTSWLVIGAITRPDPDQARETNIQWLATCKERPATDTFFDPSSMFGTYQSLMDSGASLDTIHLSGRGNMQLAAQLATILAIDNVATTLPYTPGVRTLPTFTRVRSSDVNNGGFSAQIELQANAAASKGISFFNQSGQQVGIFSEGGGFFVWNHSGANVAVMAGYGGLSLGFNPPAPTAWLDVWNAGGGTKVAQTLRNYTGQTANTFEVYVNETTLTYRIDNLGIPVFRSYLRTALPAASGRAGGMIYVSDATGGAVMAFSDGTNWLRVTDRTVVN